MPRTAASRCDGALGAVCNARRHVSTTRYVTCATAGVLTVPGVRSLSARDAPLTHVTTRIAGAGVGDGRRCGRPRSDPARARDPHGSDRQLGRAAAPVHARRQGGRLYLEFWPRVERLRRFDRSGARKLLHRAQAAQKYWLQRQTWHHNGVGLLRPRRRTDVPLRIRRDGPICQSGGAADVQGRGYPLQRRAGE